jgi:hypothetical protein
VWRTRCEAVGKSLAKCVRQKKRTMLPVTVPNKDVTILNHYTFMNFKNNHEGFEHEGRNPHLHPVTPKEVATFQG